MVRLVANNGRTTDTFDTFYQPLMHFRSINAIKLHCVSQISYFIGRKKRGKMGWDDDVRKDRMIFLGPNEVRLGSGNGFCGYACIILIIQVAKMGSMVFFGRLSKWRWSKIGTAFEERFKGFSRKEHTKICRGGSSITTMQFSVAARCTNDLLAALIIYAPPSANINCGIWRTLLVVVVQVPILLVKSTLKKPGRYAPWGKQFFPIKGFSSAISQFSVLWFTAENVLKQICGKIAKTRIFCTLFGPSVVTNSLGAVYSSANSCSHIIINSVLRFVASLHVRDRLCLCPIYITSHKTQF